MQKVSDAIQCFLVSAQLFTQFLRVLNLYQNVNKVTFSMKVITAYRPCYVVHLGPVRRLNSLNNPVVLFPPSPLRQNL